MTDSRDDGADRVFDDLRSAVESTVDVDAQLDELHDRARRPQRRSGRPAALLAAAAAVAALVVGVVAIWPSDESERVDAAGGGQPAATTVAPCAVAAAYVYLRPGVELESADVVMSSLEAMSPEDPIEFMDQTRTYEEFQRLFDDQTQFVESISPQDLPTSFRLMLTEPWTDAQISSVESLPDVLRVEVSEDHADAQCAEPTTTVEQRAMPDYGGTTTTTQTPGASDPIAELLDRPADLASTEFSIDQSAGTVTVDGVAHPLADSAQFVTCGSDGSITMSPTRDVLISQMIGEVDGPTELRLWLSPPPSAGPAAVGHVVQLSFGAGCI